MRDATGETTMAIDMSRVKAFGGKSIAEKAQAKAKPQVDKPDVKFCESAIESGYAAIPARLTLPNGEYLDLELSPHAFSTGTLGWVARPNVVTKVTTAGGATRNLRINGEVKLYLAGSKESVAALAASQADEGPGEIE